MGMYTELGIDLYLKPEAEIKEVCWLINSLFSLGDGQFQIKWSEEHLKPEHPFWSDPRHASVAFGTGYGDEERPSYSHPMFKVRWSTKNHNKVIDKFLDWIAPYVERAEKGRFKYEEYYKDTEVTLGVYEGRNRFMFTKPANSAPNDWSGYDDAQETCEYVPIFDPEKDTAKAIDVVIPSPSKVSTKLSALASIAAISQMFMPPVLDKPLPSSSFDCGSCSRKNPEGKSRWCSEWRRAPSQCVYYTKA